MEQARGRKEHAVSTGRAEGERLSRQLQAEAAALESSQVRPPHHHAQRKPPTAAVTGVCIAFILIYEGTWIENGRTS